jgi:2-dehydropantoate 2-reductase
MTETVAILGPGAVGGALAVHLASAGVRTVCVARLELARALALSGFWLEVEGGEPLVARPEVLEQLAQPVDVLMVTVKAHQLEEALEHIDPGAVENALVVPLLNGLEHMEVLRERFGPRVAAGSISRFEAYRVGRTRIVQTTPSAVVTIGSSEVPLEVLEKTAALLDRGAFEVLVDGTDKQVLWEKAARLAVLAAATSLSQLSVGALRDDRVWHARLEAALEEACAIAAADGVALLPSTQWAIIGQMDYDLTTSMARDLEAGRPSELDAIVGSVVRAGDRLGVPCPELSELYVQATAQVP